jgi:hypothetical protein
MKFMLVMYACSVIANECGTPMQDPKLYNSYKECALASYALATEVMTSINDAVVNKDKLFFGFSCVEANTI